MISKRVSAMSTWPNTSSADNGTPLPMRPGGTRNCTLAVGDLAAEQVLHGPAPPPAGGRERPQLLELADRHFGYGCRQRHAGRLARHEIDSAFGQQFAAAGTDAEAGHIADAWQPDRRSRRRAPRKSAPARSSRRAPRPNCRWPARSGRPAASPSTGLGPTGPNSTYFERPWRMVRFSILPCSRRP